MPRERKPLIAPGSVLPPRDAPQDAPAPDLMANIIARDRARRHPEGDPGIQEYRNPVIQEAVKPQIQETGDKVLQETINPGIQEPVNTAIQEPSNTETQEHRNTGTQEPGNPDIREPVNPGIQETGQAGRGGADPILTRSGRDPREPTDKATFDMPRALNDQLKMQSVRERRPARAILIQALTEYLARAQDK